MLTAAPATSTPVRYELHKFLQKIGSEVDTFVATPDGVEAKAVFSFRDRGSTVPLAVAAVFDKDGHLRSYRGFGFTSRGTTIDDHVERRADGAFDVTHAGAVKRIVPATPFVVSAGYSPMLLQDLAVRAWEQHGRPAKMVALPDAEVAIESRGIETFTRADKSTVSLEHLAVRGLVWGVEDAWIDDKHQLAAVVVRDAEFDHFEAARRGFEWLLPQLATASGVDGVARLAAGVTAKTGVIALLGGRLIDGTGKPAVEDAVVVVDGDRIVAAGPRAGVKIPDGATRVDIGGMSIVPGLWDMHAHVQQVEQAAVYLGAGVTSVRDMGNILEFITGMRDAIEAGKGIGPRVFVSGLVDGAGPMSLGLNTIRTRADIPMVIDKLRAAGCLEVKIYSSIAPELVKPIIDYAHAHGMRAVGHVPIDMTVMQAIDAGYDSISHFHFLRDVFPQRKDLARRERIKLEAERDVHGPEMKKLADALVAHHVVIDDTLALAEPGMFVKSEYATREPGITTIPPELPTFDGLDDPTLAELTKAAFHNLVDNLRMLHERGVRFIAGTDIAIPGHSVHRELELYVMAGFTPMQALQAATIVPARYAHRDKELGTVEAGKKADLVIVAGNPLDNIGAIRKTRFVVARGKLYDSSALWQLSGFKPLPQ